jgi:hypothetical protein
MAYGQRPLEEFLRLTNFTCCQCHDQVLLGDELLPVAFCRKSTQLRLEWPNFQKGF